MDLPNSFMNKETSAEILIPNSTDVTYNGKMLCIKGRIVHSLDIEGAVGERVFIQQWTGIG